MGRIYADRIQLLSLLLFAAASSLPAAEPERRDLRHFDARVLHNATFEAAPAAVSPDGSSLAAGTDLAVTFDRATGVTRTLWNRNGYLTPPRPGDSFQIAVDFVAANLAVLGLDRAAVADYEVTDNVFSAVTGASHVYLRQRHQGLAVRGAQLHVNVNREGRILSVNNAFVPELSRAVAALAPRIDAAAAVARSAAHLGQPLRRPAEVVATLDRVEQVTTLFAGELSREPIEARLQWLPIRRGDVRLVWSFTVHTQDGEHVYEFAVDAHEDRVWTRSDQVASASYRVFAFPAESPQHAAVPPPADGRVVVADPADPTASSLGWHDDGTTTYTIPRGNNVYAYQDPLDSGTPPAVHPDCGPSLACDFDAPIDFATQEPPSYVDAAVANLFYWSNVIHDVQYQYGFDEAAGNFQVSNLGAGGLGGDGVRAEAQDGSGLNPPNTCNADFGTPPDGQSPRMQMFLCNATTPTRDGSFDNGVIVHEYGHGISNRLVGGPSQVSCLSNLQRPGEGLSDWWSLAYTAEAADQGTDTRGIGTYLFGQAADGPGIRPQPYSTDPAVNDYTYESIDGLSIPHGVGSVWAQVAWETYWALVGEHGFDANLYDAAGGSGNQRAMLYVNEGLKNTICNPTFADVRDGILQAAADHLGGEDVCTLWETFGAFGLGTDADPGGPDSTSPTNGFSIPASCLCEPGQTVPVADAGPDQVLCQGASATIGTAALPGHTYSWSPGGKAWPQIVVSPLATTTYTVTATTDCTSVTDTVTVWVDPGDGGLEEDFESGAPGWTASGLWHLADDSACPSPEPGYSSPTNAMYFGQDASCDYSTGGAETGDLVSPPIFGIDASSTLSFDYLRVVEFFGGLFDKTEAHVLTNGGATSTTVFALDSTVASSAAWTSSGAISLAAFAGEVIQIRFRFDTIDSIDNSFLGWFVDDVVVTGASSCPVLLIFADGFESGDTTAWSATVPP